MPGGRGPFSSNELVNTVFELARRVLAIEKRLNEFRTLQRLYPQWNENTPPQITSNQNNYDPGNYGVLRISSDAPRQITGISNGTKGRIIFLFNVGAQNITIMNQNAGSLAANRIITNTGGNVILGADNHMELYYDSTTARWRECD